MHARRQAARQMLKMRLGSQADARTYNSNLIMPLSPRAVSQGPRPSGTCPAVAGEGRLRLLPVTVINTYGNPLVLEGFLMVDPSHGNSREGLS